MVLIRTRSKMMLLVLLTVALVVGTNCAPNEEIAKRLKLDIQVLRTNMPAAEVAIAEGALREVWTGNLATRLSEFVDKVQPLMPPVVRGTRIWAAAANDEAFATPGSYVRFKVHDLVTVSIITLMADII